MKIFLSAFAIALSVLSASAFNAEQVDTWLGVGLYGHCVPGPCLPNASAYPSPDTLWPSPVKRPFMQPGGYWTNDPVVGFSQLHISGSGGVPTYGNFLLSPRIGEGFSEEDNASHFTNIFARCWRMTGELSRWGIRCDIVPTHHAALYTFTFPATNDARIVLNLARKIGNPLAMVSGSFQIEGQDISGGGTFDKNWNPVPYEAYFYARFDRAFSPPPELSGKMQGRKPFGTWVAFDTSTNQTVRLKIAVSFHSTQRAKEWLEKEIPNWDSGALAQKAKAAWDSELAAIEVGGADPLVAKGLASHLFHATLQPSDRTGDVAGWNDEPFWDDHYTIWDTWRTLFPLHFILHPERSTSIVNSFASRQRHNNECSVGFIQGKEMHTGQGGDDVDNVIADAFAKNLPGLDREGLWQVLAAHAAKRTPEYITLGYVPFGVKTDYCWRMKSASGTLAFALNDWLAAQVARVLGKTKEADALQARSANWTNVWDASSVDVPSGFRGFVRGRLPDGSFTKVEPRKGYNTYFYEGTCWEYSYAPLHDFDRLAELMGGKETFTRRLQYAFENNLIDYGNEPSFATIWLFAKAGRQDLCSEWAARYRKLFLPMTMPGDDDSGAMAAMYLFLTAGIFPFAGTDLYAIHGASLPRFTFRLGKTGKTFTIEGRNTSPQNIYVRSAYLNGHPHDKTFLRHHEILSGGTLLLDMSPTP